jgi:hypothetical protein
LIAGFPCANADRIFDCADKNLPIADFPGFGRLDNGFDCLIRLLVAQHDFNFDLRQKIDGVFAAAINLGVAFLAPETFYFGDGHSFDAEAGKGFLYVFQFKRFYDGLDFFHRFGRADTNNQSAPVNRKSGKRNFCQKSVDGGRKKVLPIAFCHRLIGCYIKAKKLPQYGTLFARRVSCAMPLRRRSFIMEVDQKRGSNAPAEQLKAIRDKLMVLHKALIDSEKGEYEKSFGPVESPYKFWDLLINDPWFGWLQPFSALLVSMDELMESEEGVSSVALEKLKQRTRELLQVSEEKDDFRRNYFEALQREPDVIMAHAEMTKALK